ncbi:MAG: hypothetical protein WAK48_31730 [Candidatus Acidiferrum sp.]
MGAAQTIVHFIHSDRACWRKRANSGFFGTLGRGTFRGPTFHQFDIALIKNTPFGHRGGGGLGILQFRAEFFNIFNIVNFGVPSNTVRGSEFGIISKNAGPSRQIQF